MASESDGGLVGESLPAPSWGGLDRGGGQREGLRVRVRVDH